VDSMLQPAAMERAEQLKGLPGTVPEGSGCHRLRRPDPGQFDVVFAECLSYLLVPRATVRTEVGADMYGLNVKTLCQSRNDCSRITA
jgi:hypothetical protein